MYDQEIGYAMTQVRLGEIRNALGIIAAAVGNEVCRTQPMYSDILRLSVDRRRIQLVIALKSMASELELVAQKVLERCGPIQSQDGKKSE